MQENYIKSSLIKKDIPKSKANLKHIIVKITTNYKTHVFYKHDIYFQELDTGLEVTLLMEIAILNGSANLMIVCRLPTGILKNQTCSWMKSA